MIQGKIKNKSSFIAAGQGLLRLDYFLIILFLIILILFIVYCILGCSVRQKSKNEPKQSFRNIDDSLTIINDFDTNESEVSASQFRAQSPSEPSKSVDLLRLDREPRPGSITRSERLKTIGFNTPMIKTDHYGYSYLYYWDGSVTGVTSSRTTTNSDDFDLEEGESENIKRSSEFTHL